MTDSSQTVTDNRRLTSTVLLVSFYNLAIVNRVGILVSRPYHGFCNDIWCFMSVPNSAYIFYIFTNVALSGDPCDVQQCMWASAQPNHLLHLVLFLHGFGNGRNLTPPTNLSGYRLSDLQAPHAHFLTIV